MFNTIFGLFVLFCIVWMVGCFGMRMFGHIGSGYDWLSDRAPWNSHRRDE
jgi:hypothetical protein